MKTCNVMIQDIIYHPISSPKYEKLKNHMREKQGDFHNLLTFSIMHPGSRLHRERTSKKTRCRCQCINNSNTIYIRFSIQWKLFNFFTILPSNNFKSTWKNKGKQKLTQGEPSHTLKAIQAYTQTWFCTIDPSIGPN